MAKKLNRTRADRALNILVPAELKQALNDSARKYNVNAADIVRVSVRTMLPVLEALWNAQQDVMNELVRRCEGHFRKRHSTFESDEVQEAKQGEGPCW